MTRSGLVGWMTLLLLLGAALIVMVQSGQGAKMVDRMLDRPTDTTHVAIPPSMRAVTPSGATQQADRAIQDIETADQLMRDVQSGASAVP